MNPEDAPIQYENEDLLDRSKRAQELAEYIRRKFKKLEEYKNAPPPKRQILTSHNIAIIGPWGEGKTSFINLLKTQFTLVRDKGIV
jgi:hypothetical protein